MCVAIYKPEKVELPSEAVMLKCWTANPDGAGFAMLSDKEGLVEIFKGYMTFEAFKSAFYKIGSTEKQMLIHFRIGTSGTKDAKCTHPFPVSSDFNLLTKSHVYCKYAMIHNGILPFDSRDDKWSDTMEFAAALNESGLVKNLPGMQKLVSPLLETNKIAVLSGTGEIVLCGKWQEQDHIYFSNLSWNYTYNYSNYNGTPWYTNPYYLDKKYGWKGWNGWKSAYDAAPDDSKPKVMYNKISDDCEVVTAGIWIKNSLFKYVAYEDEEFVYNEQCPYCTSPLKRVSPLSKADLKKLTAHFSGEEPEFLKCDSCKASFALF